MYNQTKAYNLIYQNIPLFLATCAWFGSNQLKRIDLMNLIPISRDWLMANSGDDNNIRVY